MKQHISLNTWVQYYDNRLSDGDTALLYSHLFRCAECRALNDRVMGLRRALDLVQAKKAAAAPRYAAVAAAGNAGATGKTCGNLQVALSDGQEPRFLYDTLSCRGCGIKYALCPEGDTVLRDDDDLMVLTLEQDTLGIQIEDTVEAYARIRSEEEDSGWTVLGSAAALPVPKGSGRVLEIFLAE